MNEDQLFHLNFYFENPILLVDFGNQKSGEVEVIEVTKTVGREEMKSKMKNDGRQLMQ